MKEPYVVAFALRTWDARQTSWETMKTGRRPNEDEIGALEKLATASKIQSSFRGLTR